MHKRPHSAGEVSTTTCLGAGRTLLGHEAAGFAFPPFSRILLLAVVRHKAWGRRVSCLTQRCPSYAPV